jgi:hypothetical protein
LRQGFLDVSLEVGEGHNLNLNDWL